ncbi:MAG TPA: (2Fe-2S)-binding protein [Stellaceae bacterium]|jgi:predicted molibdopterin-dependent oxidoreductase YjgC|nr:(2Fe-2S)-binding protein [Stellaceae bacterium]
MFRRLPEAAVGAVTIAVDGASVAARAGDTVAAALLASGIWAFRTSGVSGTARGPYCMMGVCFDCLVAIDGIGSRQACLVPVREGMRIETQRGRRAVGP